MITATVIFCLTLLLLAYPRAVLGTAAIFAMAVIFAIVGAGS